MPKKVKIEQNAKKREDKEPSLPKNMVALFTRVR